VSDINDYQYDSNIVCMLCCEQCMCVYCIAINIGRLLVLYDTLICCY